MTLILNNRYLALIKQIHLYTISLDQMRVHSKILVQTLTPKEIKYANSYAFNHLTENYIISRSLLRHILSHYIGIPANVLEFQLGPYGKPYITSSQNKMHNLKFNLSHSKDMLCIAVTKNTEVGIDVEFRDNKRSIQSLYSMVLTKQEQEYINSLNSVSVKLDFFYSVWTLKEAIVKALGYGLSYDLTKINLILESISSRSKPSKTSAQEIRVEDNITSANNKPKISPFKSCIYFNKQEMLSSSFSQDNHRSAPRELQDKQCILHLSHNPIALDQQYSMALALSTEPKDIKHCDFIDLPHY